MNPMNGTLIPVIGDAELVDMNLGTGVVKVTPAHDFNDYECALRHNLEMRNIMNDDGTMNDVCGAHSNLDRFEARNRVIQTLDKDGLFIGKERKVMRVATCSRSGDIIEPLLKPQWFLNCSEMAKNAADAVRRGELVIVPEFHKHTWFQFLDNIQDWCISRQLWWGHRLPLYQVHFHDQRPQEWVAAKSEKEAAFKVTEKYNIDSTKFYLERDPDVLDTWFSSGLFPISSFGWPQETEDLEKYYPLSLMETGSDILFFWVARMVMLCTHMTGKLPFNKIFLHPMVRDSQGLKMSKSLGNVIDPVEIIEGRSLDQLKERILKSNVSKTELKRALKRVEKDFPNGIPQCGTDALRLALCSYLEQGRQINLDIQRVITQRNFCNKLWQATRFCVMNMEKDCVSLDAEVSFHVY